jgi:hypothetical protein
LDFSDVRSVGDAERLVEEGRLVKVLLFPAELGGPDVQANVVYVPQQVADIQQLIIGTLVSFTSDGLIDQLDVQPAYRGESFVPTRIVYHASHSEKGGRIEPAIDVW